MVRGQPGAPLGQAGSTRQEEGTGQLQAGGQGLGGGHPSAKLSNHLWSCAALCLCALLPSSCFCAGLLLGVCVCVGWGGGRVALHAQGFV